ncbi:hypothetical protein AHiyo6_01830 [Arthrobacter sp. Hiyo6]|nr:hypothetical protein AHiyo6_01830 [Arthrobacter sp. Hiyo6]
MVGTQDYSRFERIFSALVTPMHADESIDYGTLSKLVDSQLGRGVEASTAVVPPERACC